GPPRSARARCRCGRRPAGARRVPQRLLGKTRRKGRKGQDDQLGLESRRSRSRLLRRTRHIKARSRIARLDFAADRVLFLFHTKGANMAKGIDLATDAGREITAIRGASLDFVARYYRSPTSHFPSLSASEARLLSAGMKIVAVYEGASTHASYFSRTS